MEQGTCDTVNLHRVQNPITSYGGVTITYRILNSHSLGNCWGALNLAAEVILQQWESVCVNVTTSVLSIYLSWLMSIKRKGEYWLSLAQPLSSLENTGASGLHLIRVRVLPHLRLRILMTWRPATAENSTSMQRAKKTYFMIGYYSNNDAKSGGA